MKIYLTISDKNEPGPFGLASECEALSVELFRILNLISSKEDYRPGCMMLIPPQLIGEFFKKLEKELNQLKNKPDSWQVGERVVSSTAWSGSRAFPLIVFKCVMSNFLKNLISLSSCAMDSEQGLFLSSE